ncbi:MAG: DUF4350 domain-containing protein [Ferruginibacter sp.]
MLYFFALCCIFYCSCNKKNAIPSLRETYNHKDTNPFGAYAAKNLVQDYFSKKAIITNRKFSSAFAFSKDSNAIYFCVARNLYTTEKDAQAMLDFAYVGNTVVIAANNFDSILQQKLVFISNQNYGSISGMPYTNTYASYHSDITQDSFSYFYRPLTNYFKKVYAAHSRIIAYNTNNIANTFVLFWGKGRMIVHCEPRLFSNYFLLTDNNFQYLQALLNCVENKNGHIYWDDYYRNNNVPPGGNNNFSSFSELLKHPPLAAALWLLLGLFVIYILFAAKRRQKIIPVIKPNNNSSIALTQTMARLYYQQRDNKNIAEKMITYFNEYIRKTYFISPATAELDFINLLSRKSGVNQTQTSELYYTFKLVNNSFDVDDNLIVKLDSQIRQFYKNKM